MRFFFLLWQSAAGSVTAFGNYRARSPPSLENNTKISVTNANNSTATTTITATCATTNTTATLCFVSTTRRQARYRGPNGGGGFGVNIECALAWVDEADCFEELYWIDPTQNKDVDILWCLTHAHLLYLFKNYDYEDLDYRAVAILMSSQVYLTINYRFSIEVYDDLQDKASPTQPTPSIQTTQAEIFDIIQTHRYNLLRFIRERPAEEGDRAMDAVVRVATGTGSRDQADQQNRHWQSINHPTCYGRLVPDTEDENLCDGSYRIPKRGQTYAQCMDVIRYNQSGENRSEHAAQ